MKLNIFKNVDYSLIALIGIILLFGLVVLSSASGPMGYQKFGDNYHYVKHQLVYGLLPGIFLLLVCLKINYSFWRKRALILLGASLFLLLLVFIPGIGTEYGTARSWISIGGLTFQPSELLKLTFLFYLAAWLEARGERKMKDMNSGLVPFLISLGIVMLLLILQPDIGTMSVIVAMAIIVY
nr:FtsW/RodA/SpoVE family cell cycle protein [Candidatus Saccharibacteria bacterium]NIV03592.1 FtsW/RodA/SpoVE family cell cycle protein [Calditrichia bacterium]NIS38139.1 FtsW/RodA/SpoVE family cell cycle protein [Candidatus Saccharibacteria bacterium]NIV71880.1 FtsW/RodA/SpoVE family cell cycle protein [Calditrichia bacterium]NIV98625.1 FtsW/RodA/SpoVE family cell cycle protein [Candidatus Saccharibacteria bacterium]